MEINVKLYNPFVAALNKMRARYGEEFERLNGFHNTNLNFTEFIDGFIDSNNVADSTIDANANANSKDICSLLAEIDKPHTKLLAYNKIFYEMTKKYGIKTAQKWLAAEYNGEFYLHDAPSSSMKPYCYKGEELITVKYRNQIVNIAFKTLYNWLSEEEVYDETIEDYAKFPQDLYILDVVNEETIFTKVSRIVKHSNDKPMRVIKYGNGYSQIVTEDHPIITTEGDIPAKDVTTEHQVMSIKPNYFTDSITEIDGVILTKELGWLTGIILAEAFVNDSQVVIHQNPDTEIFNKILHILNKYDIPFSIKEERKIATRACPFINWIKSNMSGQTSAFKRLPTNYIHYNYEFLDGVVAGVIDGDGTVDGYKNRHCHIRMASHQLIHQLSNYLHNQGIFCGDRTPFKYQSASGFEQKLVMFGIGFTLTNEDFFSKIGSLKVDKLYIKRERIGNFANKRYQFHYDLVNIIENTEFIEPCEVVYDITTETGHFICNNVLSHNCFAFDLEDLATRGLYFVEDFGGGPPRHLPTFVQHVKEFVSWNSNRISGACGLPNLLIYCYYFWREDVKHNYVLKNPSYHRDQHFQELIYALNQPYLRINQSAFTNVTIMDRPYLMEIFGGRTFPDGSYIVDDIEEIIEFQKDFMKVVSEIRRETMFTFPVLTFSLLRKDGKFVDEEFAKWCNHHNMQWCDSNFFISEDVTSLSSCCRLINDFTKLDGFINSIGGTALKIGSVKVNTINLARIALEAENEADFFNILHQRVDLCLKTLDVVRSIIQRNIEKGLLPNYTSGLIDLKNQYNTIGISALYEAVYALGYVNVDEFGNHSYSDEGLTFASSVLDSINQQKDSYGFDYSVNIEAVPAERAAVILCKKDNLLYPGNILEREMYGNQWIPLDVQCTLDEKIRLGAILDKKCGGGQIMHVNIQGPFANEEQAWNLLNHIADKGVIYFAYNLKINVCKENHGFVGNKCTVCGGDPVDSYQRVVGFLTPSKSYSKERKVEFAKRYWFDLND